MGQDMLVDESRKIFPGGQTPQAFDAVSYIEPLVTLAYEADRRGFRELNKALQSSINLFYRDFLEQGPRPGHKDISP